MKPKKFGLLSAAFAEEMTSPQHGCDKDPDVAVCGASVKYVYRSTFNAHNRGNVCAECKRLDKQGHPDA